MVDSLIDMDKLDASELQANHRFQVNVQRRMNKHSTDVEIRPLNEERAVKAASDFIGEAFIFSVAGALVIYEVSRSARFEALKAEARQREVKRSDTWTDFEKQVEEGKKQDEEAMKRDELRGLKLDAMRARVDELDAHGKRARYNRLDAHSAPSKPHTAAQ